jgi:serine palmitoyltransferase
MIRESKDYNITQKYNFLFSNLHRVTGETLHCLNLGSYNYLGFAENPQYVQNKVQECLKTYGTSCATNRVDYGTYDIHTELEKRVAQFVGHEDSIACAMGFATNATIIPSICDKSTLIVSDSENHSSIVFGARSSVRLIEILI